MAILLLAGSYQFGYDIGLDESRHERKNDNGIVFGSYSYKDAHGDATKVSYVADDGGFRILQPGEILLLEQNSNQIDDGIQPVSVQSSKSKY